MDIKNITDMIDKKNESINEDLSGEQLITITGISAIQSRSSNAAGFKLSYTIDANGYKCSDSYWLVNRDGELISNYASSIAIKKIERFINKASDEVLTIRDLGNEEVVKKLIGKKISIELLRFITKQGSVVYHMAYKAK